jgi:hypothetical protein
LSWFHIEASEAKQIPLERLTNGDLKSRRRNKNSKQNKYSFGKELLFNPRSGCWIVGLWKDTARQPNVKRCIAGLKIDFDQAPVLEAQRGTRRVIPETDQLSVSDIIPRGP